MATEREVKAQGYKRINFFKGFLTTEHDWNDAERYHLDKRKLHNRLCHAPGVVAGHAGELKVMARARGDLSIEVQPGYAIDGQGHDLVLWETQIKNIVPEEYKLPQTLYVVLRFVEELTDFIAYKENLEYKGHRRVLEGCKVEISQTAPDIKQEVELARILLEKNATRVRDARDPHDPRANEIDLRFVPHAGVAGSFLDPTTRHRVAAMLNAMRRGLFHMARDGKVGTAHDALSAVLSVSTLHAADQLDLRNIFEEMQLIVEMQAEIAADVEVNHPTLAQRKEFGDFRKHVEILKGLLGERRTTVDALQNLTAYQQKAGEIVLAMFGGGPPVQLDDDQPKAAPVKKGGMDWEAVKSIAQLDLPNEIDVDGKTWTLVDKIDVMDKDSEEAHALAIQDAKDSYRSRQKLKYPDGTVIEDVGRAHVGGYCQYTVKNVKAGKELAIVRRMDYVYGDYEIEFVVDGKNAGVCSCAGTDRANRWRNWPYVIPAELITKDKVTVKQNAGTAGRDINMFRYWFYQPK
ncbi:MAG: hypothetical protein ACHQ17_01565 [Polyangia bacterium]